MESRGLLWGCGAVGCLVICGAMALALYFACPLIRLATLDSSGFVDPRAFGLGRPSSLDTPGIRLGEEGLAQRTFVDVSGPSPVTDIREADFFADGATLIGVASRNGAVFVNERGEVIREVRFDCDADHVDILPGWDGTPYAFLNRGSWAVTPSLIGADGKEVWRYVVKSNADPFPAGVDDMAAGDLDGDGTPEFVVGFNGQHGVHLLDADGNRMWRSACANVWHVEATSATGDGQRRIVHSDASGMLTVRDVTGAVVTAFAPGSYASFFSLARWPGDATRDVVVMAADERVHVVGLDGVAVADLRAPACSRLGEARATTVRFGGEIGTCFAVLVDKEAWGRAVLYVYAESRELVFMRVFSAPCASIATHEDPETGSDCLLVGATGQVIAFRAQR